VKPGAQGAQQSLAFGVLSDGDGEVTEAAKVNDLPFDVGDVIGGKKFRVTTFLFPLVSRLFKLFIILADLFFELLAEVLIVPELALQFPGKRVQRSSNGEGR